jgi:transmembrane sensor
MKENNINQTLKNLNVPTTKSKDQAWKEIEGKLNQVTPVRRLNNVTWVRWAAAASILFLGILWFANQPNSTHILAQNANQVVELPDGSEVQLRKGSSLSWNADSWDSHRTVTLDGEAYFEVEKGSRFKVAGESGLVEVLGTRFNVFNGKKALRVDCYEGKVRVSTDEQQAILTEGLATKLKNNSLLKPFEIEATVIAWDAGEFAYDRSELAHVFHDLEIQFDVEFQLPFIDDKEFTGAFHASTVEEALEIVCLPMGFTYEFEGTGQIKVSKLIK